MPGIQFRLQHIYRDGIFLAVTNSAQYNYTDQLLADTQYNYSVIANSYAGNSNQGIKSTVEPLNNGHFGTRVVVSYLEVVRYSEVEPYNS